MSFYGRIEILAAAIIRPVPAAESISHLIGEQ
jgi:hypothetical protein